nr:WAT1-related protein At4g08300-like [Ipomoea batatas]
MADLCGSFTLFLAKIKPYLAMLSLQFGYAGMYIVTMICFKRGMSHWILVVYRHAVALLAIAPFAIVLERPVIDQNFYYVGLKSTTATYASAFVNLLPAVTFIMAVIFRAPSLISFPTPTAAATTPKRPEPPVVRIGSWAQSASLHASLSKTLEEYPAELSLAAWVCVMGVVEGGIVALIMERDMSSWVIGFDSRLLAAAYSVICSGIAYYVQSVVNKTRGPVFVTAFSPLSMVITAVLAAIILAENVHAGSLIGAFIIVIGLYSVVWGKSKDETNEKGKMQELPIVMDKESVESPATIKSKLQDKTPQEA